MATDTELSGAKPQVIRRSREGDALGRKRWATPVWNAIALLFAVVMFFPIYWMILTTIKSGKDLLSIDPAFWPTGLSTASFKTVFTDPNFLPDMRNVAVITIGAVVMGLVVGFFGAVAVARFRFKGRNFFIAGMLVVQMVPLISLVIPMFFILKSVGLYDQGIGVVLCYLVFTIPYIVWTLRSFIVNIPKELDEAALVDGCTPFGAFMRVVLPLTIPGLITTGVFCWIQAWNEFVIANILLSSNDKQTAMVWLTGFSSSPTHGADYGSQMAGALMVSLPVIILFVIFQRRVASGLTAGAVKG